ncbi:hypothetical protein CO045_02475 [Candidatus Peregrinibacteria bacterium CG_4_9_14_0_2_um_filter_41_14]|nr:MAG: hypothetical protein COY06_01305 [Candidatus Peregrinibacteria bacterium CG_4_10_14_0_2_um_filter_41_8]PJC38008.1 MAG: hypothetical protein CO045_02475 [Candidatus Peregrinibacteria bacterium CG_4_9_14_0_2_um_filter_41_14]
MVDFLQNEAWPFLRDYWLWVIIGLVAASILWKLAKFYFHFMAAKIATKRLVFLKVTLPRQEGEAERQEDTEKDFREKISLMSQLFRSLHELRELTLSNRLKVWLFKLDIVSFELVCIKNIVHFYVVTYEDYQSLVEKQITSYYPSAEITMEPSYEIAEKGLFTRCYYAYLNKEFWYPIKDYKLVESDPLNSMTNVFSKLEEDDRAAIQIAVRPRGTAWQKQAQNFGSAIFKGKKEPMKLFKNVPILKYVGKLLGVLIWGMQQVSAGGTNAPGASSGDSYVRMLQTEEEVAKRIGEKANEPGFDTVVRMFASSKTKDHVEKIVEDIFVSLTIFKDDGANSFQTRRIVPINSINNRIMLHNFINRYFQYGEQSSILVPSELATMYHFPHSRYNTSPVVEWLKYKILPAPVDTPQTGVYLGDNLYRGVKTKVHILRDDRTRHHYIIGKSGAGKSVFLNFMARQDIINGDGVCVIDPHGDLIEDLLNFIPKERAKDVIIFDPSDQERPMGLNILEARNSTEMDLVSSQATEIFIKLFGDEIFGPRIQHYFRNACLTLMEDPDEGATLIDVPRMFTDDEFMKFKVSKAKNPIVRSFWEHEYANTGDRERQEMIPYFSSKFGPFITNSIMRNTIGQAKSAFNLRDVMDNQKILLINLAKGKIGDLNTQLLGLIFVAKVQMAAMSRADMPKEDRKDFYLYVDEFQNFATDSFATILSEARKYRLNLIMAHQYINQLVTNKYGNSSTQVRDAVFGNVGTLMSFKVGAEDADYLAKEYAPELSQQDIIGIANYKAYIKLNVKNSTSRPFSLETLYDKTGENPKVAAVIKEYSRIKYGRKLEFVNQEIGARIGYDFDA